MSKILLIGQTETLQQCAAILRQQDYKVIIHKDVTDDICELFHYKLRCIVWDVQVDESNRTAKYKILRKYHRYTPIVIIDDKMEKGVKPDSSTLFMRKRCTAIEIVNEMSDFTSVASVLSDNDRLDMLEKEYGFTE